MSSVNRKILVIVEGEGKEVKLFNRLKDLFLSEDIKITPYKNNLYKLYDYLQEYCDDDFDDLDFLLALREHEQDENTKKIFDEDYTDILLIFDFEPQDRDFDIKKIFYLMKYFDESTENGKLYINYPTVESFYHLSSVKEVHIDNDFKDRKFSLDEMKKHLYKRRVNTEGTILDIKKMSKEQVENIIFQQVCKANYIMEGKHKVMEDYSQEKMLVLLDKQNNLLEQDGEAYVLNTCSFFVLEFYPSNIDFMRDNR